MWMFGPAYGGPPVVDEEPFISNVIMVDCGSNKIAVIKFLKQKKLDNYSFTSDTPLCLHDAMVAVNNPRSIVYKGVHYKKSLIVKKELEELGATIEIEVTEWR